MTQIDDSECVRFSSPDITALGKTIGAITLIKLVNRYGRNRADWIWRVRGDECGHEYEIPGRQIRDRQRDAARGKNRDCYVCSRLEIARNLNERATWTSTVDRRSVPMSDVERLVHCGRWI